MPLLKEKVYYYTYLNIFSDYAISDTDNEIIKRNMNILLEEI